MCMCAHARECVCVCVPWNHVECHVELRSDFSLSPM